jgi:hypothetical protein
VSDQRNIIEGTIDAIRDGVAVILIGEEEVERPVPADELPDEALEGSRVEVTLDGDLVVAVVVIEVEPSTEDLRQRMDRLKIERPSKLLGRDDQP